MRERKGIMKLPAALLLFFSVVGPGIAVMLADTDAGSLITAAQSGALFGYKLLLAQFILIPILYICQELTVRLGITTGMGHGELIRHHFGKAWAWLSVSTLIVACIGAILSEYSGLTGVGLMFGVPSWATLTLTVIFLVVMVLTGSYRSIERIIVAIGLFELVFIYVAWKSHPSLKPIMQQLFQMPFRNGDYLYLMAGNIGAVIMPWMIFYQQSAVVDKKLTVKELNPARWDTAIGAIITQVIMASVLMAVAATVGTQHPNTPLDTVQQISHALTPFLGENVGRILFAIGMIGASLVAAVVVSLTAAWALGEVTGYKHSLEHHPREAPWFYTTYAVTLILGALFVGSGINLVKIGVAVNVMNALLLPIVLGFLFVLAIKTLPEKYSLRGWYKYFTAAIIIITSVFGLIAGLWGIFY